MPTYINPAEFLLDLTSFDFARGEDDAHMRIEKIHSDWSESAEARSLSNAISTTISEKAGSERLINQNSGSPFFNVVLALLHRSFIKSYRDVVAYGIRFAMYIGQCTVGVFDVLSNNRRSCYHDGNCLAAITSDPKLNSAIHQRNRMFRT